MSNRRVLMLALAGLGVPVVLPAIGIEEERRTRPPRMVLRARSGAAQRAALGTFCWEGRCVDVGGFRYPERALIVAEDEDLQLDFALLGSLRRLAYTVWPYEENIQPGPPHWSAKTGPPVVDNVLIFPVSPAPMPGNLAPGLYVFDLFAKVRRGGSSYQGFKLRVEPVIPQATPDTAAAITAAAATPRAAPGAIASRE